jgi:hypothetical protein
MTHSTVLVTWCISILLLVGCDSSSLNEREWEIEKNVYRRIDVSGIEYEIAMLPFEQVTDADVKFLATHHPKIRRLNLGPHNAGRELVTDEGLKHLGQLKDLEFINSLQGSAITDEGLAHLGELHKLDGLDLRGTGITGTGLSHVRHLRELERIDLPASLTTEGVESASTLHSVRVLSVVCNQDLSPLGRMKNLDRLEINGTGEDADFSWLLALDNLDDLTVWTISANVERAFPYIGQMKNLRQLSVQMPMTDVLVRPLSGCENLREIFLADCSELSPTAVESFDELAHLESLRLHNCPKSVALNLSLLADTPSLRWIDLSRSHQVDDDVLAVFSQFANLRRLTLSATSVTSEGCEGLYREIGARCTIQPARGPSLLARQQAK